MARDDVPYDPDPDDWFSEPDVTESLREQPATTSTTEATEVDDWLDQSAAAAPRRRRRGGGGMSANARAGIVIGAVLLVVLLIGLWVGGVFGSGHGKSGNQPLFTISTPKTTTTGTTPTTPSGVAAPTTVLKPGDTGPQVRVLQRALTHLGYSTGTIDGQYGPATTQAVKNFQTAHGLTADGVCGPKTITALKNALKTG